MRTRKATPAETAKYTSFVDPIINQLRDMNAANNFQPLTDEQFEIANALAWKIVCFEKQSGLIRNRTGVRKVTG